MNRVVKTTGSDRSYDDREKCCTMTSLGLEKLDSMDVYILFSIS